jgi:thymidylate synthase (FAD)
MESQMELLEINCLDKGFVRLIDRLGDDSSIVQAARVSYGKGTKTVNEDRGLIRYLMRHAHTTPFEMVQFKFHIKAPIFVIRQWHRHRMWSYNEYSGRYSEMKEEFYLPEEKDITKQSNSNKQGGTDKVLENADELRGGMANEQEEAYYYYTQYLEKEMRKELARINLPLATYSEMYASVNLHNLFNFLRLRLDTHAQYEIRIYAQAIASIVKPLVPIAWEAFEDYILNSIKFSKIELENIASYITEGKINDKLTGRELQEFKDKMQWIKNK